MRDEFLEQARILVVDDEPQNVRYLQDVLEWAGYQHVEGVSEPRTVLTRFRQFDPDLVILDLLMPEMDGFQLMEELRTMVSPDVYLPILVLTSDISREARRRALVAGARDFLTKPMSPTEIRIRVGNLLETRGLYLRCQRQERLLAARTEDGGAEVEVERELLERWAAAIDLQHGAAVGHSSRVSETVVLLARKLGMAEEEAEMLGRAALLHDLGSVALLRRAVNGTSLSVPHGEEFAGRVLRPALRPSLVAARQMIQHRAERYDGGGPLRLAGGAIPIAARLVAVAERLEALSGADDGSAGERAERALSGIRTEAGSRFDPEVVEALSAAWAPSLS